MFLYCSCWLHWYFACRKLLLLKPCWGRCVGCVRQRHSVYQGHRGTCCRLYPKVKAVCKFVHSCTSLTSVLCRSDEDAVTGWDGWAGVHQNLQQHLQWPLEPHLTMNKSSVTTKQNENLNLTNARLTLRKVKLQHICRLQECTLM